MDDPAAEIRDVVLQLTTGNRVQQQNAIERYFTPDASFKHPFCAVKGNREAVLRIFQWYKILSPRIKISVNSIAFDAQNDILYVNISQIFKIWFVPFYAAHVNLTTVLHLVEGYKSRATVLYNDKYYIKSQEDLYQVDEFVKFFMPWNIGTTIIALWHWFATLFCIIGVTIFGPIMATFVDYKQIYDKVAVDTKRELTNGEASGAEQRRDSKRFDGSSDEKANSKAKKNGKKNVRDTEPKADPSEAKVPG